MDVQNEILETRADIDAISVSIADIASAFGNFKPDLLADPRLRERLGELVGLCRVKIAADFILPATCCGKPFNPLAGSHYTLDAKDPRGHWPRLAVDVNYRAYLGDDEKLWRLFIKLAKKAGLSRVHLDKYGEWWHFSDYDWRPDRNIAHRRYLVLRELRIL